MCSLPGSGFVQMSILATLELDDVSILSVNLRGDGSVSSVNMTEDGVILEAFDGLP